MNIKCLLRGNLATPSAPNYSSLATLHQRGDHKSLNVLLRKYVRPVTPQEVDVEQYLSKHMKNVNDTEVIIQECTKLNFLDIALSPQPGNEVRNIAFCSSPRDTGKEAMKCGRVIVRCCDKSAHETKDAWIAQVLQARRTSAASSIADGLCELIRTHVETQTLWQAVHAARGILPRSSVTVRNRRRWTQCTD